MRNENFASDIKILREHGHYLTPESLFAFASIQLNEHDDDIDYDCVFDYIEAAAKEGHVEAMTYLSSFYSEGKGVEKSEGKAFEWTKKAAENGNADAQFNLGSFYENGYGTQIDYTASIYWFREAEKNGVSNVFNRIVDVTSKQREYMQNHFYTVDELRAMDQDEIRNLWYNVGEHMNDKTGGACHYGIKGSEFNTYHFFFDYECVNGTELEVVAKISGDIYGLPSDSYINRNNPIHKSGAVHYLSNPSFGKDGFEVDFGGLPHNFQIYFIANVINTDGKHNLKDISRLVFYAFNVDLGSPDHSCSVHGLQNLHDEDMKALYFINAGFSSLNRIDIMSMSLYSSAPQIPDDIGKTPLEKPEKPQRVFGKILHDKLYKNQNMVYAYSIPLDTDGLVPGEFYDSNYLYSEDRAYLYLKGYNNRINIIDFENLPQQVETVILTATAIKGDLSGVKYILTDEFDYSEIYTFDVGENFPEAKTVIIGKLIRDSNGFRFEAYTEAYDEELVVSTTLCKLPITVL
jgi:hypothetical protein